MKTLNLTDEENQFLVDRRIACHDYPLCEAAYDIVSYIQMLENQLRDLYDGEGTWDDKEICTQGFGEGSCPDCDCGS